MGEGYAILQTTALRIHIYMDEIWHPLEFRQPTGQIVRVIDAPGGIELFASDVCQILFGNSQFNDYEVELTERIVVMDGENIQVFTMCATSIYALEKYVDLKQIKNLAQWVRTKILPNLKKNNFCFYPPKHRFKNIDYKSKESLINYLNENEGFIQEETKEIEETIDFYLRLIQKKLPITTDCPALKNNEEEYLRSTYFEIVKNVVREFDRYEYLYHDLVISTTDLLMAQELDLVVFVVLKRLYQNQAELPGEILKQGLVLQALNSITNISSLGHIESIEQFYIRLLENFRNEIIKLWEEEKK
ncbi:hypothetical protein [Nostoc sp. CCY0012]|uniref:hypothetical protein n=1 Tax=Nostoc sp. CCY0012 TaxID=1056123 RepID=UPI0039C73431